MSHIATYKLYSKTISAFITTCLFFLFFTCISFSADGPPDPGAIDELADSLAEKLSNSPSVIAEYFAFSKENRMNIRLIWDKKHGYVIMRLINEPEKPDWVNFVLTYKGENSYWYVLSPEAGEGKRFSLKSAAEGWNQVFGIFFSALSEAAGKEPGDIILNTAGPFIPEIGLELTIDSMVAQIGVRELEHPVATWFSPEKLALAGSITAEGSHIVVTYPDRHTTVLDGETGLLIEERWEDNEGKVFRSLKMIKSDPFEGPADFRDILPWIRTIKLVDLSAAESFDIFYSSILEEACSEMDKNAEIMQVLSSQEDRIRENIYIRSKALWSEKVKNAISSPSPATETMEKVLKVILLPAFEEMASDPEYSDLSTADFLNIAKRSKNLRDLLLDVRDVLLPGEIVELGKYIEEIPSEKGASLLRLYRLGEKQYLDGFADAYIEGLITYTESHPEILKSEDGH